MPTVGAIPCYTRAISHGLQSQPLNCLGIVAMEVCELPLLVLCCSVQLALGVHERIELSLSS